MAVSQTNAEKLDAIQSALTEIKNQLLSRQYLDELTLKHDEFINGNGKPGAKTQLENIKGFQKWIMGMNTAVLISLLVDIVTRWLK